jgi:hypothetical protein
MATEDSSDHREHDRLVVSRVAREASALESVLI